MIAVVATSVRDDVVIAGVVAPAAITLVHHLVLCHWQDPEWLHILGNHSCRFFVDFGPLALWNWLKITVRKQQTESNFTGTNEEWRIGLKFLKSSQKGGIDSCF